MPQAYVWYVSRNSSAVRVHNVHAPINQARLFSTAFYHRALGLSKWIVGACYPSACGKYLQLSMYGASGTTYMTLVSDSKHWSLSATHLLVWHSTAHRLE